MSVLACNRYGCEAIMCDWYSRKYGYICHECLLELKQKAGEVSIKDFMETPKDYSYVNNNRERVLMEIDREFRGTYNDPHIRL